MKKELLSLCAAVLCMALAVTGCQKPEQAEGVSSGGTTTASETAEPTTTTAVLAVTDSEGSVVTDPSGNIVTEIVSELPTEIRTATDDNGATVTEVVVPPVITVETDPKGSVVTGTITEHRVTTTTTRATTTTTKKPDGTPGKDTPTTSTTTTKKPTSSTTTTKKPTTTTTKKPTTSTTTTTTKPPTTTTTGNPHAGDPWYFPYDVDAIIEDCKTEIARVGLVWDDSLVGLPGAAGKPIGLPAGMSEDDPSIEWAGWDNPDITSLYTRLPDRYSLKDMVFNDLIPFYVENQGRYSLTRCKIWFEPYEGYPGEYQIYFLYATY